MSPQKLDIPGAARFRIGDNPGVHVVSMFGDAWCWETETEDGEYIDPFEMYETVSRPPDDAELCVNCVRAAEEE